MHMNILIADDSAAIRKLLRDILEQAGFAKFEFAVNGAEALSTLTRPGIDLALLDWHMPILSGLDVLGAVRAKGCQTPIIMVTAESDAQSVKAAMGAGVDQYVAKPFRPELLIEKVYRALTISRRGADQGASNAFASAFASTRTTLSQVPARRVAFHAISAGA